jgi:hypothetical protein
MTNPLSLSDFFEALGGIAASVLTWLDTPAASPFESHSFDIEDDTFKGWFTPAVCQGASLRVRPLEGPTGHGVELLFSVNAPANPFLHGSKRMQTQWVAPTFKALGLDIDILVPQSSHTVYITLVHTDSRRSCVLSVVYYPRK